VRCQFIVIKILTSPFGLLDEDKKNKTDPSKYDKSWLVDNASKNEINEILTVYLVNSAALYSGDTDQDDL